MQRHFDIDAFAVPSGYSPNKLAQCGDCSSFFTDQASGNSRVAAYAQASASATA
jgi:hypothetical protein